MRKNITLYKKCVLMRLDYDYILILYFFDIKYVLIKNSIFFHYDDYNLIDSTNDQTMRYVKISFIFENKFIDNFSKIEKKTKFTKKHLSYESKQLIEILIIEIFSMLIILNENEKTLKMLDCDTYSKLIVVYKNQTIFQFIFFELTRLYDTLSKRFFVCVEIEKSITNDAIKCKREWNNVLVKNEKRIIFENDKKAIDDLIKKKREWIKKRIVKTHQILKKIEKNIFDKNFYWYNTKQRFFSTFSSFTNKKRFSRVFNFKSINNVDINFFSNENFKVSLINFDFVYFLFDKTLIFLKIKILTISRNMSRDTFFDYNNFLLFQMKIFSNQSFFLNKEKKISILQRSFNYFFSLKSFSKKRVNNDDFQFIVINKSK